MKTRTSSAALAALLYAAAPAHADEIPSWCQYALSDAPKHAPSFERYAVKVERVARSPRVDLHSNWRARMFRTNLREAAKEGAKSGPNFAGHYALASWGCGTGCLDWALVDLRTGKVSTDENMFSLENNRVDFRRENEDNAYAKKRHATYEFGVMLYRPDSSLLVTLGQPNEDESRDGMAYYHWTGKHFEKIAFFPAIKLCHKPKD